MVGMTVRLAESEADVRRICPVLLQLRPAFDNEGLVSEIKEQMKGIRSWGGRFIVPIPVARIEE